MKFIVNLGNQFFCVETFHDSILIVRVQFWADYQRCFALIDHNRETV